ncbi:histidine kinase [Myroides ceti]|uniref:Histidine kinase n=1 Tax=Paenimyroides ceti TaxID=395087 RepID=A0ABT8CWI5_9FLAO|nr:histidine kinase [Paenimyroides ceti]MDN3708111.1 histidine kinase [Paenimyroides ceti]
MQTSYFFIIGLLIAVVILVLELRKSKNLQKTAEQHYRDLEMKVNNLQLENLESKLNPHLFKNILNSIQSHAYQSYYTLEKLANVLDFVLYETQKKYVTPREEIEFAKNLIEINKIKISPLFDLKIKIRTDEKDPLMDKRILAPLISVDLIENAFKHADILSPDSFISILIELKNGVFSLTVSNKTYERKPMRKKKGGFGANSLETRLGILYKDQYKLEKFIENDVHIAYLKIKLLENND